MERARVEAACEACGKTYHVPSGDRTYRCKACGGAVRAPGGPDLEAMPSCDACQALNPPGSAFCAECGAALAGGDGLRARAGAGRDRRLDDRRLDDRRRAAAALQRAHRAIQGVGWLYRVSAVLYGLGTVAAIVALGRPDVPLGLGLVIVAVSATVTALLTVGAIQIRFQPFLWSTGNAALATLSLALTFLADGVDVAFFVKAGLTVLFWLAVAPTVRFDRLIRAYPDLYIAHRIHGTHLRRKTDRHGGEDEGARARRLQEEAAARGWRAAIAASVIILGLSAAGTFTVYAGVRPPDLQLSLERFDSAWGEADVVAIAGLFPDDEQQSRATWLALVARGNGWAGTWPSLSAYVHDQQGEAAQAWFPLAGDSLAAESVETRWRVDDGRWRLVELRLPLPPIEPDALRFARAWATSDPATVAALYPEGSREKLERSIDRSVRRRGWGAPWPALGEGSVARRGERRIEVTFDTERGSVVTQWRFEDSGLWNLTGLQLPRR